MNKLKIVFCINSLEKGGAERVITNLANYFSDKYTVYIITLYNSIQAYKTNDNIIIYSLDKQTKKLNVQQIYQENKIKKVFELLRRRKKLKSILKEINPDIIISFLVKSNFTVLLSKPKNCKVIISERNDPNQEYNNFINNTFMKKLYPKADGIIYQTNEAKKFFEGIIKCPSEIIPNPINDKFIIEKPYQGIRDHEIVSVGRLEEQKNFKCLIKAFSKVNSSYPNYKLTIYGEGTKRKELEELIKELNLDKVVELPGQADDIEKKIFKAKCFVLSSNYEGMPNALMEAMALGLPVISTDCPCGGPKDLIVNNKNGILVSVNNDEEIKNGIIKIIENDTFSKMISENACSISKDLNPTVINNRWEEFILKIFNE